jgi:hypothetical protein
MRNIAGPGWLRLSLCYWLIAALIGLLLRLAKSGFISGFDFNYFLHAHSHVAMLGWVYLALVTGIIWLVDGEPGFQKPVFKRLLWATQVAVIGMLFTFPFQGYGAFSIAFSTLHILLSYGFTYVIAKEWRQNTGHLPGLTRKFLAGALTFMVLSSFGPWALAYIGAEGMKDAPAYDQAIYFYLHFQYNGWFTFALIALWLAFIQPKADKKAIWGFWLLFLATFPAYGLSLLGFDLPVYVDALAWLAAAVQLIGFGLILPTFLSGKPYFPATFNTLEKGLFYLAFFFLASKFLLQLLSIIPALQTLAFATRPIIIGFLHWVMVGFVSTGLLYWFRLYGLIRPSGLWNAGLLLYGAGFLSMEALLISQGITINFLAARIPAYSWLIVVTTFLLVAGVGGITISQLKGRSED